MDLLIPLEELKAAKARGEASKQDDGFPIEFEVAKAQLAHALKILKGESTLMFRQKIGSRYMTYSIHAAPNPGIPIEHGIEVWIPEETFIDLKIQTGQLDRAALKERLQDLVDKGHNIVLEANGSDRSYYLQAMEETSKAVDKLLDDLGAN